MTGDMEEGRIARSVFTLPLCIRGRISRVTVRKNGAAPKFTRCPCFKTDQRTRSDVAPSIVVLETPGKVRATVQAPKCCKRAPPPTTKLGFRFSLCSRYWCPVFFADRSIISRVDQEFHCLASSCHLVNSVIIEVSYIELDQW